MAAFAQALAIDPHFARAQAGICRAQIARLEGVSDEYLEKVYSSSACLIAASEGEGFGLPLIEAAQHHLPMIIRDIPVFREVAGDHAFYFQGLSADNLARSIKTWLESFEVNEHPTSMAMPWLTWEESAHQLRIVLFGSV